MNPFCRSIAILLVVIAIACCGCSGRMQPVQGVITYSDGAPAKELAGGTIEFDSLEESLSARGAIEADGSFQLTTLQENDGVPVGKYRVLIAMPGPTGDEKVRILLDPKYSSYDTSGLSVDIVSGANKPQLVVERYVAPSGT